MGVSPNVFGMSTLERMKVQIAAARRAGRGIPDDGTYHRDGRNRT